MKRNFTLTLICFFFGMAGLYAQCENPNGIDYPAPPGTTSCEAVSFCNGEINGYCGQLGAPNVSWPFALCGGGGVPNNMEWLAFAAAYTDITITVTPYNCPGAGGFAGIQAGLYTGCETEGGTPVPGACQTNCQTTPIVLTATNLLVGNVYYLFIDGCAGDQCGYTITTSPPDATALPPFPPLNGTISGYTDVCPGAMGIQYSIPPMLEALGYNWTLPAGWAYTTVAPGNTILVDIPSNAFSGQICVDAYNDCETSNQICTDITVSVPPTGTEDGEYCQGQTYVYPGDGQNYTQGVYVVTLFGQNWLGCDSSVNLTVVENPNMETFVQATICQGESYTVCNIPYNFPGEITQDCSPNINGCDSTIVLDLTILDPIAAVEPPPTLGCGNNSSVYLDAFNSFGTSFYWETADGDICDDPTNLWLEVCLPGTYCLTATWEENGVACIDEICVTVPINSEEPMTSVTSADVSCPGDTDGSATITVSNGGIGPFTYDWNPDVSVTNSATGLTDGTYTVTVTATGNGCSTVETIVIGAPSAVTITTTQQNIACNGGNTGSATATPSGGTTPYSYSWCNGQTSATATNLIAGPCQVIVTDDNGCSTTATVTISESGAMTAALVGTDVLCNGDNTGSATATPSGGTAPYGYNWCNGQTGATATNLGAGSCSVTITDAEGCSLIESVTLSEPGSMSLSTDQTDVLCDGDSNGTATVTASGGVGPYSYVWCNNQTTPTATGLPTGSCQVVVTDDNGCTQSASVTISAPNAVSVNVDGTDVTCQGEDDGTATATPSGGTAPYSYSWCNGQTGSTATGLGAGPCQVVITDDNGCTISASIDLSEPSAVTISTTQQNIACNGGDTGSATATVSGGTTPYSYTWCNGQTSATATNLTAGPCQVVVTDDNGCSMTETVTITESSAMSAALVGTDVLCNGEDSGSATATPSGGTAPYGYNWCNGQTGATATNLGAGACSVTITDAEGCSLIESVTLSEPGSMSLSTDQTDVLCDGDSNGTGTVTASGGVGPYTYMWCNNQTTSTATGLPTGSCDVVVTDDNGCTQSASVTISAPNAVSVSVSGTDVSCEGGGDGTATATPGGGTGPYTYEWCNGQTSPTATGLGAGDCEVVVTDDNGCTVSASVSLDEPVAMSLTTTQQDIACSGGNSGSATVSASGGTTPYSYQWCNGDDTSTATDLGVGTCMVIVTDANGCTSQTSVDIEEASELEVTVSGEDLLCNGGSGSATANATGGTGPYDYDWCNGSSGAIVTGLDAGACQVTVTDANGCTETASVTLSEPNALSLSASGTDVSCAGSADGEGTASASGGTSPYSYTWCDNQTGPDATGLDEGDCEVMVTDANGCTQVATITIAAPNALSLSVDSEDVSCFEAADGTATVSATGGDGNYSYSWCNGQGTATATGLEAGDCEVVVTDGNGCSATISVSLSQPPSALIIDGTSQDASCGDDNGSINITVSGGTTPYSYDWGVSTSEDPTNLGPGNYTVTVTDANDCTETFSIEVNTPSGLQAEAVSTDASCSGSSDGTVSVTVNGGTTPYDYVWDTTIPDGSTGGDDLPAGTYNVTVTDGSGCTFVTSATVEQPEPILLDGNATDETCGESNGTISLSVQGGTAPYSYNWQPGNLTDQNPTGLTAGNYTVIVTDANDCTAIYEITISTPNELAIETTQVDVSCFGGNDGSIDLTVNGGVDPFNYDWGIAGGSEDPANLTAGDYTVIVTDATDCSVTTSVTIAQPPALSMTSGMEEATCGDANGSISIVVSGGTAPYQYNWNNNNTTDNPTGLDAGEYLVTITDANDCELIQSVEVTSPAAIQLSISSEMTSCFEGSDGSIDLEVTGGTAPFDYSWDNGAIIQDPTNLLAGSYEVVVTDANGCTEMTSIEVIQPTGMTVDGSSTNATCGEANGSISVSTVGGTSPYSYAWSNGAPPVSDPINLPPGSYTVTVTDNNDCTTTYTIEVETPTGLSALTTATDVACNGDGGGTVDLEVSGGVAPFTYLWSNGSTTEDLAGVVANTYEVTVTDDTGCTIVASGLVSEPEVLLLDGTPMEATCGEANGSISLTVTGGTMPYSFSWDSGSGDQNPTGLTAGDHTVEVTDANGCVETLLVTVTTPNELTASATQVDVSCEGGSDGSIDLTVTGGTAPFSYSWTNGETVEDPQNLPAGQITGIVTDANGCEAAVQLELTEPPAMTVDGFSEEATCGEANGSIDITVSGGTAPYTYDWDNAPDVEDPIGIVAGTYNVIVSDLNGCMADYQITVTTPNALTLSATPTDADCNGDNSGSIDVDVSGGVAPFDYTWSTGWTGEDLIDEAAGVYTVTVTDATDCSIVLTETINEPTAMELSSTSTDALCNQNNGSIDLTVVGGTAPYSYDWGGGITVEDPTNLGIGNFTVVVTDGNGCTAEHTETVSTPTGLELDESSSDASCNGGANGTAGVTVNGGTPPFNYAWSNLETTPSIMGLSAGTYTVTVTDADGCTVFSSSIINEPAAISISGNALEETCDDANGSISIVVSGGTEPYSYMWSNASTDQNPQNLADGDYTVEVTDANGCIQEETFTVTEPTVLSGSLTPSDASCNGGADGVISAAISGGTPPFSYAWSSGGPDAPTADNLTAGSYNVVVTDANDCSLTLTADIGEPMAIMLSGTSEDALCGETNGSIDLTVSGGTAPYSYSWSNGATTEDPSNLGAGSYTVTVTDSNDCTMEYPISVNTPSMLSALATPTDALCFDQASGQIDLEVSGGSPPFTYQWSNGSTSEDLMGVGAGLYTVDVTDSTGCVITANATVDEPTQISITGSSTDALCNENNGTITIDVTGGTGPYTYEWSNGDTNEDPTNLGPGSYLVTVTDVNDCTMTYSQEVSSPSSPTQELVLTNVSCNEGNDGAIDLMITGGIPPFDYEWSTGATTEDISGLSAGTYMVTVTDNDDCTYVNSVEVSEPQILEAVVLNPSSSVNCSGGQDGGIVLEVTGGTEPYVSFDWDNAADVQNPTGLGAGAYTVTVTDANGCTAITSTTINEPPMLELTAVSTQTDCSNTTEGSIDLSPSGGVGPYSYLWNNGSTEEDPEGLASGIYTVEVTDANGCMATLSEEVTSPDAVQVSIGSVSEYGGFNVSCSTSDDGSATAQVIGGVPPYSYEWSDGSTTTTANNLTAGTYTVTVTDVNGCSGESVVSLEAPDGITLSATTQDVDCHGGNDGAIIVDEIDGGAPPHLYSLNGGTFGDVGLFAGLTAGMYEVVVQDANGCEEVLEAQIVEPGPVQVEISTLVTADTLLQLGDEAELIVQINRDTASLQQYGWTQGLFWSDTCTHCDIRSIYPTETVLYEYLVVDENGCIGKDELLVQVRKYRDVFIPNAFSPNGDGHNDMFFINAGQEVLRINHFRIYNRWGEIVFELSDFFANAPELGWDGRFNGEFLNPGVFVYHAEVLYLDGRVELLKGDVTLMR